MKDKLIINRVESLLEGIEGIEEECIVDSLMRIDEDNFDRCGSNHVGGCYYCVHDFPGEQILSDVRVCNPLIKLYEVK